jgi:hypothetical protein
MPLYDFICALGHSTEKLAPFSQETAVCSTCKQEARRAVVNRIQHAMPLPKGERLQSVYDAGREAQYQAKRTDDPAMKPVELLGHAATVRTEARLLQGQQNFDAVTGVAH